MAFIAYKGRGGAMCICALGFSYALAMWGVNDWIIAHGLTVYSFTFYLAAILCIPACLWSLSQSRKTGQPIDTFYYIPVYFIPVILALFGYMAQNYDPKYVEAVQAYVDNAADEAEKRADAQVEADRNKE